MVHYSIFYDFLQVIWAVKWTDQPANTSGEPCATEVQPVTASPTLPQPRPFIMTVVLPTVIGAACAGHGLPGNRCEVLLSPCLLTPSPFTITSKEWPSLTMPEQCVTSASVCLVTAGTFDLHQFLQFFIPGFYFLMLL